MLNIQTVKAEPKFPGLDKAEEAGTVYLLAVNFVKGCVTNMSCKSQPNSG